MIRSSASSPTTSRTTSLKSSPSTYRSRTSASALRCWPPQPRSPVRRRRAASGSSPPTTTSTPCASTSAAAFASLPSPPVRSTTLAPSNRPSPPSAPTTSRSTTRSRWSSDWKPEQRRGLSVREHGHGQALVLAEEDASGDGIGAELVLDLVEGGVELVVGGLVEGEGELEGSFVLEVTDRDADHGEALGGNQGMRGTQ